MYRFLIVSLLLPISHDTISQELPTIVQPTLETVTVTGERVERTLQETASSVSVTTAADLDAFPGADTLNRIFEQTPNVTSSGEGNQGPTIRGANTSGVLTSLESFFGGSQPRTTIQVDGRQLTFNEYVYSDESAWDIERVEIFRGPQTTTQGRNALAGAVFIETANPNHEYLEGKVRGIVGEYGTQQLSGVVSGPIGNGQVAYRVSIDQREQETFIEPTGLTENIGANPKKSSTLNLRAKLSFRPTALDKLEAMLTLTHTDTSRPQTDSVDAPFESLERFNPGFSVFETQSDALVFDVGYQFTDSLSLANVTTYSDVAVERLAPLGTGNADINSNDLTNETILNINDNDDALRGLVGLYVSTFDSDETLDLSGFDLGVGQFSDSRESVGIFAEGTWSFTERLHLTAGARWQEDKQNRDGGFDGVIPIDFDESYDAFLPKFEVAYDLTSDNRMGFLVKRGFNAGGFTFNFDTFEAETFEEETLWNYEFFHRATLLDERLNVNSNVFYSDFTDLQIATLVELAPDFFANVFSNVSQASSVGFEIDTRFQVNKTWFLQGGLGITQTEFEDDSNAGALIEGNEFQRSPQLTAVAGVIWSPISKLDISLFGRYSDSYFSDDANVNTNKVDSYAYADIQISYHFNTARIFLDATNITDDFHEVSIFDNGSLASVGAPRQVSLGLELNF